MPRKPSPIRFDDLEKAELTNQLISTKRNDLISAWFTDLREKADIVDGRHHFYTEF